MNFRSYKLLFICFASGLTPFLVKCMPCKCPGFILPFCSSNKPSVEMNGACLSAASSWRRMLYCMHFSLTGATLPRWMVAFGNLCWYFLQTLSVELIVSGIGRFLDSRSLMPVSIMTSVTFLGSAMLGMLFAASSNV